jgi:hypothetical protein
MNKTDYPKLNTFFNIQKHNMFAKEGSKIILDKILINQVIYVPMIAKVLDMEESTMYDELSDEQVRQFSQREEKLVDGLESYQYHADKRAFDESKEVKVRLLCN